MYIVEFHYYNNTGSYTGPVLTHFQTITTLVAIPDLVLTHFQTKTTLVAIPDLVLTHFQTIATLVAIPDLVWY